MNSLYRQNYQIRYKRKRRQTCPRHADSFANPTAQKYQSKISTIKMFVYVWVTDWILCLLLGDGTVLHLNLSTRNKFTSLLKWDFLYF